MNNRQRRTAIVLQGGGALGAYECGVLQALYEARGQDFSPAIITGISIGAVNAAILAGAGIDALAEAWHKRFALLEARAGPPLPPPLPQSPFPLPPVEQLVPPVVQKYASKLGRLLSPLPALLRPLWRQLIPQYVQQHLAMLGNESMYRLRPEYLCYGPSAQWLTDSLCDTTPLRETLRDVVDLEKLNNGDSRVVVTAVNVATGEAAHFGNTRTLDDFKGVEEMEFANHDFLSIDHVLASGSLPPNFPATWVDGGCYWDGGLFVNTPLSVAIDCLERCDGEGAGDGVEREVVVVELFPMAGSVPKNIPEVVSRYYNIVYSSKIVLDKKLFYQFNDYIELYGHVRQLTEEVKQLAGSVRKDSRCQDLVSVLDGLSALCEDITCHQGYRDLSGRKKINYFTRIPFVVERGLGDAGDFSKAAIEARIRAGREEAVRQKIEKPQPVTAP